MSPLRFPPPLRLAIGILALSILVGMGFQLLRRPSARQTVSPTVGNSIEEELFAPGDKPITIQLRGVSETNGQVATWPAVIRASRSRVNQMKQAVRAFLEGPREGRIRAPSAARMRMNALYLTPDGTAVVDLTVTSDPSFGFWEETLFVRGLVHALTNHFPEVRRVRLLMDGQESGTLAGHYALGSPAGSYPKLAGSAPSEF